MASDEKNIKNWVGFSNESNPSVTLSSQNANENDAKELTETGSTPRSASTEKPVAQINVASHVEQRSAKRATSRVAPYVADGSSLAGASPVTNTTSIDGDAAPQSTPFKTGKLLTTVFPINTHCAWVTLPEYEPTKMPKILSQEQIALSSDTYTKVMKSITVDIRFVSYCALYSRVLPVWVLTSVFVLLVVLFSASTSGGFPILVMASLWMLMLIIGIFFGIIIRKHLAVALRQSVRDANRITLPKNLLIGVQDRGQLSCHKVVILFVYYEFAGCESDVMRLLKVHDTASELNTRVSSAIAALKHAIDLPLSARLDDERAAQLARELILEYSQQYVKAYMKKQLLFPTRPLEGVSEFRPKHCAKSYCLCQFIEMEFFNRAQKRPWYENLK